MASRITALRLSPKDRVIVVLGAGATKACGGPLTGEILPRAFASRHRHRLAQLEGFLVQQFGLPKTGRGNDDFPQLPLLLSLLDTELLNQEPPPDCRSVLPSVVLSIVILS